MLAAQPEEQQQRTQAALDAALRKVRLEQAGRGGAARAWPSRLREADEQIFACLRAMLGLDQVESINVGAAADACRGARVLPRDRPAAVGAVGG